MSYVTFSTVISGGSLLLALLVVFSETMCLLTFQEFVLLRSKEDDQEQTHTHIHGEQNENVLKITNPIRRCEIEFV